MNSSSLIFVTPAQVAAAKVSFSVLNIFFGSVGVVGNSVLAIAIFGQAALRSKSSLILAFLATFDAFGSAHTLGYGLLYAAQLGLGVRALRIRECFAFISAPKYVAQFAGVVLILACALDRCLMLKRPLTYSAISTRRYIGGWVAAAVVFAGLSVGWMAVNLNDNYALLPLCQTPFIFNRYMKILTVAVHLPLSLFIVAINYYTIYFVKEALVATRGSKINNARRLRFQQSLLIVVRVYIFSWVATMSTIMAQNIFFPLSAAHPVHPLHLARTTFGVLCAHVNASANFFIYYGRNSDYRREFRRLLRLNPETSPTSVVVAMSSTHQSRARNVEAWE